MTHNPSGISTAQTAASTLASQNDQPWHMENITCACFNSQRTEVISNVMKNLVTSINYLLHSCRKNALSRCLHNPWLPLIHNTRPSLPCDPIASSLQRSFAVMCILAHIEHPGHWKSSSQWMVVNAVCLDEIGVCFIELFQCLIWIPGGSPGLRVQV